MKFLPEDKKKTVRALLILIVAVGGIVYFNFFTGSKTEILPPTDTSQSAVPNASNLPAAPPVQLPSALKNQGGLLPYGGTIDLGILDDARFKSLKSTPPLEIFPEELGRPNPFGD